jgi:glycosyltransferase involved in cell wall biosynthesis
MTAVPPRVPPAAPSFTTSRSDGRSTPPGLCLLVEGFWPILGGGETQMRLLLTALAAEGVRTTVVTQRRPASAPPHDRLGAITIHRVPPRGQDRIGKYLMVLPAALALVARRKDYDVILSSGIRTLGAVAVLVARLLGRKVVLRAASCSEVSGEYAWDGLGAGKRHLVRAVLGLRNRILARADAFIAVSEVIRAEYLAAGFPTARIHLVPNGTDVARFHPVDAAARQGRRRELSLPMDRFLLVYTGKLNRGKGLPLLLRAVHRLGAQHPRLCLLLVGGGKNQSLSCEDELRDYVAAHGLDDAVRFVGYTENVAGHLQAADAFVLPSDSEAMPNALIEAMATGLPCIGTAVGGILDILRDGENGRMIPVGDEDALVARVAEFLENPGEAARLGANARRDAEVRFSHAANVARVGEVLRGIL